MPYLSQKFQPILIIISFCIAACELPKQIQQNSVPTVQKSSEIVTVNSPTIRQVIENAIAQTKITNSYDPSYVAIPYPGGDVPMNTGVCTDVIIRAFRQVKVDLQKEVHEDMRQNFTAYPKDWNLTTTDRNIDHRRVPNLMVFLKRKGKSLPVTRDAANYQPGDLVTWDLGGGESHIGIVSNVRSTSGRLAIVHNIGAGTRLEDVLFNWQIIGHYRYF
ncbi:MAG: DUF1287 domain-containing protein [Microcoleus sp.]